MLIHAVLCWCQCHVCVASQRDLESIRSHLLQRKGALINLTGDDRALSAATAHVNDLLTRLPETAASSSNGGGTSSWQQQGLLPRINEALVVPTQVRLGGFEPVTCWFFAPMAAYHHVKPHKLQGLLLCFTHIMHCFTLLHSSQAHNLVTPPPPSHTHHLSTHTPDAPGELCRQGCQPVC